MLRKILNILGTVILVILIGIVVLVFDARISGEAPSLFGYQVYRVSSGSMSPTLEIGDVILVKSVGDNPSSIKQGDIVTYKAKEGDMAGKIITHQVSEPPERDNNGIIHLQTQGVAQGTIPDPLITSDQVLGVFVAKIPFVNFLYSFFLTDYGIISFIGLIVVLFGFELVSLVFSYKALDEKSEEAEELLANADGEEVSSDEEPDEKKKRKKHKKDK